MIYINSQPLPVTMFPDGTSQVWKIPVHMFEEDDSWVSIVWRFEHESEFMHLAQLKTFLDSIQIRCGLKIEYLPYGRQDKMVSNNTTFALHTFADLLNFLNFEEIKIVDPHSEMATKLINNSKAIYLCGLVFKIAEITKTDKLCYPDHGSYYRYRDVYPSYPYICASKKRNQDTGKIESINFEGDVEGQKILIVDDICDGGTTFRLLAKDLLDAGAMEVNLFVTHGIFSQGLRIIHESGINRIFTKDGEMSEVQNHITYRKL